MKKTRTRGKQLSTLQILESRINSVKLRKELEKLSGVNYINYVIEIEKLKVLLAYNTLKMQTKAQYLHI
jgi:hypothetical protein|tara:strand:- start:118 stop:324 length:207 start_codon:yes stop_codon:yes gene_type:complete